MRNQLGESGRSVLCTQARQCEAGNYGRRQFGKTKHEEIRRQSGTGTQAGKQGEERRVGQIGMRRSRQGCRESGMDAWRGEGRGRQADGRKGRSSQAGRHAIRYRHAGRTRVAVTAMQPIKQGDTGTQIQACRQGGWQGEA
jgi:hypothetical protein